MFALDVATGDPPITAEDESVLWAAWSPDGSQVAYILEEPGPRYAVVVSKADGSHPVTIVERPTPGQWGRRDRRSWSPDGSRIAYSGTVGKMASRGGRSSS